MASAQVTIAKEKDTESCLNFKRNENLDNLSEIEIHFKKLSYYVSGGDDVGAGDVAEKLLKIDKNFKLVKYYLCLKGIQYHDFLRVEKSRIAKRNKFNKSLEDFVKKFPPKEQVSDRLNSKSSDRDILLCHEMKISDDISHLICD